MKEQQSNTRKDMNRGEMNNATGESGTIQQEPERISECINQVLAQYYRDREGDFNGDLYHLILSEVEQSLIKNVLGYCQNNQSKAARILGLNRGTLRKKISDYHINLEI